jgi:hypothetical protein
MAESEEEMSDVMVVLADEPGMTVQEAVAKLQAAQLSVTNVDEDDGVVEGTIDAGKVAALRGLPFVKYVRDVFNYVNKPDPGDDEPDVNDAGA